MDDKLKHQLYDHFLKDTPISFDSVTDKQWAEMRATVEGVGISLSALIVDLWKQIGNALQPAIKTINDALEKKPKK